MRTPRFTVLRLMLAVAAVALGLGGWLQVAKLRRLADDYAKHANFYSNYRQPIYDGRGGDRARRPPEGPRHRSWRLGMTAKYEHAAGYPWMPIGPDASDPEPAEFE